MPSKRECSNSLDIDGLANQWDQTPIIRDELRAGQALLDEDVECTVKTCGESAHILMPIVVRMQLSEKKIPDIVPLREEVSKVYNMNKQPLSVEDPIVIKNGWMIRKMAGFVKMKCRRGEVSIVFWQHC